jgi:nitric oxide reductase subunit C
MPGWIEITVAALFAVVVLTLWLGRGVGWLAPRFWRNAAIVSSAVMGAVLAYLTFDSVNAIRAGSARVPAFSVINREIGLRFDAGKRRDVPVFGREVGFFGAALGEDEAAALVNRGKLTFQARNCMECHTLLGHGAYFAPDLTRAWLDPRWGAVVTPMLGAATREEAMAAWLQDPGRYPAGPRRMPNLRLSSQDARALVAFLKWMSGIDTNGFPPQFAGLGGRP